MSFADSQFLIAIKADRSSRAAHARALFPRWPLEVVALRGEALRAVCWRGESLLRKQAGDPQIALDCDYARLAPPFGA